MIHNVGIQDRLIRVIIGLFFIVIGLNIGVTSMWGGLTTLVGLIAVITGSISFCPFYKVTGLNSSESE